MLNSGHLPAQSTKFTCKLLTMLEDPGFFIVQDVDTQIYFLQGD